MLVCMQTIGLIGGMSWHSTLEYYRTINELVAERRGGHASAKVVLESLDFAEIRECQLHEDWDRAGRLLAEAGQRCARAGADVVLICTNLMHRVADEVQGAIDVPLLHIGDAIADAAVAQGWSRLGVLGARWVMEEEFYTRRLRTHGLHVEIPGPEDRTTIDRVIFDELTRGVVREESRRAYAGVIERLGDEGAQAVVLGCTEIELLVRSVDSPLPIIASMRTHAEAAVAVALGEPAAA
jgi:aspartate racemase